MDPQSRHGTEIVFADSRSRPQQITCGMCGTMYTSPTGAFLRCPTCPQ
jgi:ribosomal protein S27E